MITLFTDTDTDFTPEKAKLYGYKLISMPYSIGDETFYPYEDGKEVNFHEFYDTLRGGVLPKTSALGTERYLEYFEPEFEAGNDILYVHFSRAMTATFENMDQAVKLLKEKYPERKFYEIDTKGITTLSYMIVREIGKLAVAGASAEELVAWAEKEVNKFTIYFFADDLKFFKRSGRVSGLAAVMGTLVGIRPIIYMSDEGKMVSIGKEKGRKNAMERLVRCVTEFGDDVKKYGVVIGNTDAPDVAQRVGNLLKEQLGDDLDIEYVSVNPTAGSHCGPDGVGVIFHAVHR